MNRADRQVYWRKDFFIDYYGEIFNYDDAEISIRQESYPYAESSPLFPNGDPPVADWGPAGYLQPNRFRLFADANQGYDAFPLGRGRVLAPRQVSLDWTHSGKVNTFRCVSWEEFQQGKCPLLQDGITDTKVSLSVYDDFSSTFDGDDLQLSGRGEPWTANDEFKSFHRVVVVNQEMFGTARERFFFAERGGTYYGLIRWDYSEYDGTHNRWQTTSRATGLKRGTGLDIGFKEIFERGLHDRYVNSASLRIAYLPGSSPERISAQSCPYGSSSQGALELGNPGNGSPSHVYDVTGFNSRDHMRASICVDRERSRSRLTTSGACPGPYSRGAVFVDSAIVYSDLHSEATEGIYQGWEALCSPQDDAAFRISSPGNPDPCGAHGQQSSGAFLSYRDCYDASGARCSESASWVVLCSKKTI